LKELILKAGGFFSLLDEVSLGRSDQMARLVRQAGRQRGETRVDRKEKKLQWSFKACGCGRGLCCAAIGCMSGSEREAGL